MRFLLIAFLMCLLPMRGWTASAMAMSMATAQVATAGQHRQVTREANETAPDTAMPADCPMHIGATDASANGQPGTSGIPCSGCDTCELCLAIASFTAPQFHATPFSPSAASDAAAGGFVSADRASRLKPPIS